jgi:hypothetical protein
MEIMG